MKRLTALLILCMLLGLDAYAGPPTIINSGAAGILTDSNCDQAKYYSIGTLCQDTDDGKLYKGTGAAVEEVASGADLPTCTDGQSYVYDEETSAWVCASLATDSTNEGAIVKKSGGVFADATAGTDYYSPTEPVTLVAGTATENTAPLYFQSGTNLTTPEAGAMEFDGANLYFTPSDTRKTVSFTDHDHSGTYVESETDPEVGSVTGIVKSNSGFSAAASSDIIALFASGSCSGYLKSDGSCDTPSGAEHDAVTLDAADGITNIFEFDGTSTQELELKTQTANYIFAGPTSGDPDVPAFRALVVGDIPDLSGTYSPVAHTHTNKIAVFSFSGNGSDIPDDTKTDSYIPTAATITGWVVTASDASACSVVVDIWADAYANFPPTVADTITASAKPTLSSALVNKDTTLTGWTTAVAADSFLRANIDSNTCTGTVTVTLFGTK